MLETLGYKVLAAGMGSEALAILERGETVDLLFTDLLMPGGMNGRELAERALAIRPSLKVLFTSGHAEGVIGNGGKLDPSAHLLRKPYRREELVSKLRELLNPRGI
jgi:CheY-like chemotaxis protein